MFLLGVIGASVHSCSTKHRSVPDSEIPALKSWLEVHNLSTREFSALFSFVDFSLALKCTGMKKQHGNDQLGRVKWDAVGKSLSIEVPHNPLKAAWRE